MTSKKLWARIYFFVFRHWPQKVVDERMARVYARDLTSVRAERYERKD